MFPTHEVVSAQSTRQSQSIERQIRCGMAMSHCRPREQADEGFHDDKRWAGTCLEVYDRRARGKGSTAGTGVII